MAERALRGTRLGATSYENDRNTDLAPRQEVTYDCPRGHRFSVTFATEAETPTNWECRFCGDNALMVNGEEPQEKKAKPARTHWDMLLERRSMEDLEEVLAERLALLRARRKEEQEHLEAMQEEERQSA
ncbi:RNA polymerase-binding protein RbpA [Nocardiopsis rhodophaea]|uniref:RNA polymerase-binding protein RbpA n=1 Tax=Nocardiopsis rhodophaea TaxID=280238 RepID=A0ABN2SQL1_9ACTN